MVEGKPAVVARYHVVESVRDESMKCVGGNHAAVLWWQDTMSKVRGDIFVVRGNPAKKAGNHAVVAGNHDMVAGYHAMVAVNHAVVAGYHAKMVWR